MKILMDESGNGNRSQPLIVGAVELGDDADDVEQLVRDLYKRLGTRRDFNAQLAYVAPDHVHGFVRERSALSNASQHLGQKCVLRVDLEDFFPSISSAMAKSCLEAQGYDEKAAELAVSIVTIGGKLPIGLSTSPFLSNLAFLNTDNSLVDYSQKEGLSFTRYVDDLTFSGDVTDRHLANIIKILDDANWSVNTYKTAFMRRGGRQYVTGLYVGESDRPHIPRKTKRQMRWISHMIEKFGYETYWESFGGERDEMHRKRLLGWACYIFAVDPDLGYPLLRTFYNMIPEEYGGPPEWGHRSRDLIARVSRAYEPGEELPAPTPEVVDLAHQGKKLHALVRAGFAAAVENAAVEQMATESPRSVPSALAQIQF